MIFSQEAIDKKQFVGDVLTLEDGDIEDGFLEADDVLEGVMTTGGQDHFYMECVACLVYPVEKDAVKVYVTSQSLLSVQVRSKPW